MKTSPEHSEFCEICHTLKNHFDALTEKVNETWNPIKAYSFEKAVAAVSCLYQIIFKQHFEVEDPNSIFISPEGSYLAACSDYLNKYRDESTGFSKSIDQSSWENFMQTVKKECLDFANDPKPVLIKEIGCHIVAIVKLNNFYERICEPFMFDETFKLNLNTKKYYYEPNSIKLKVKLLHEYYRTIHRQLAMEEIKQNEEKYPNVPKHVLTARVEARYVGYPMLRECFGISDKFKYKHNGKEFTYDLQSLLIQNNSLTDYCENIHVEAWNITPTNGIKFKRNSDASYEEEELYLRALSTDLSDKSQKIDLNLSNMLCYGDSETCFIFSHIRATKGLSYYALINLLKRNTDDVRDDKEVKEEAKCIEKRVAELFEKGCHPMFSNVKITSNHDFYDLKTKKKKGEIDVAVYDKKSKTLILIEVKSTYIAENLKDAYRHQICLMFAGHQLDKVYKALKTDKELLFQITGDQEVKSIDDLRRIETLIVSNSFEFDGKKFKSQEYKDHRKISLLELMIRVRPLAVMLILDQLVKFMQNNPNVDLNKEIESLVKDLDLCKKGASASIDDFLNSLDIDIWEKIRQYREEKYK
ncbi:MAG: hypothetical protein FWC26_01405 [Fibromonadales bacterium]|nr:hypothetical protein [Fibromonadales bacterium]